MKKIDRRRFLQLAGAAMLVGAAGSLTGCAGILPGGDGSTPLTSVTMIRANQRGSGATMSQRMHSGIVTFRV